MLFHARCPSVYRRAQIFIDVSCPYAIEVLLYECVHAVVWAQHPEAAEHGPEFVAEMQRCAALGDPYQVAGWPRPTLAESAAYLGVANGGGGRGVVEAGRRVLVIGDLTGIEASLEERSHDLAPSFIKRLESPMLREFR